MAMILTFRRDGTLTSKVSAVIIKLISKNLEVLLLLNWRPLTMLTFTEKICTKIVVNQIKKPTSRIIDTQQNGFLEGKNIMDNLLTYRIAQEVAMRTK